MNQNCYSGLVQKNNQTSSTSQIKNLQRTFSFSYFMHRHMVTRSKTNTAAFHEDMPLSSRTSGKLLQSTLLPTPKPGVLKNQHRDLLSSSKQHLQEAFMPRIFQTWGKGRFLQKPPGSTLESDLSFHVKVAVIFSQLQTERALYVPLKKTKHTQPSKYPSIPKWGEVQGVGGKEVKLTDLWDLELNNSENKPDTALDIPQIINWCHFTSASDESSLESPWHSH